MPRHTFPMKKIWSIVLLMASGLFGCGFLAPAPKGDLVYCSYSKSGSAGLGKDYCELIADVDSVPKVVVALHIGNRFNDPEIRAEFPVEKAVVDSLCKLLADNKVYRLNGYSLEEPITGGYAYRIYMEYASGEKVNARWYGNNVKDKALAAYWMIERFFEPWRQQARTEIRVRRIEEMEQRFDRLSAAVKKGKAYPAMEEDIQELDRYMGSYLWQQDYEADERGELPQTLKRGVLSQDALYNLLQGDFPRP